MFSDFHKHVLGGVTDGLHGHGGEPVGEHGTDEETSEGVGLENVDSESVSGLSLGILSVGHLGSDGVGNTGNEGTEEGEGNEAGGSDGETLANSGGSVTSGIEVISVFTDLFIEVGHLSNTTGIVRDGSVAVNGEGDGKAAEHANGSKSNTVHGSELEGNKDGDGEAEDGDNAGKVTEGETVNNVGGGTVLASFSELTSGCVLFGGVVLGDEADEKTGPETHDDADVALPLGSFVQNSGECNVERLGEHEDSGDHHSGHKNGGNPQLDLKLSLNVFSLDVSEELADEGGEDSDGGDDEGEVDGIGLISHIFGGGGDDEGGTGGLSEGTEKIGTHTSDITNVITDVVSDSAGVLGGVLGEGSIDFTSEIGTDISGLGVDTTTDSSEEGDGGATETISRDELEEVLTSSNIGRLKGSLVGEDEDFEDEEGKTNEDKSEDLTTLEGDLESVVLVNIAKVGCLVVANGCNDHADVTTKHGGGGSNDEGEHGEGESLVTFGPWHINGAEDDDREDSAESGESKVFFSQEGDGALK